MRMAIKLIGLLLYWGTLLAAGCIYGFGAAVLVLVGAVFAGVVVLVDEATEGQEDGENESERGTGDNDENS